MIINLTRTKDRITFDYAPALDTTGNRHFLPLLQELLGMVDKHFSLMDFVIASTDADFTHIGSDKNRMLIPVNHIVFERKSK